MNKADFGVTNLATLSPQHGLVIANAKLGQGPPSSTGSGTGAAPQGQLGAATGATGGDAYGAGVSRQAAQGMFTQASRNAKSDEARTSIEQLVTALGLKG